MKTYFIYEGRMLWAEVEGPVAFWAKSVNKLEQEGSREFFETWGGCEHLMNDDDLIHWLKKEFKFDVEVVG